ncbi:ABC transporter substrate-binding protein [Variovorax saccharolyticus]|uniref:ABC transporter substrate-binding protein n=1 Tax=Variovorax saccharolyticus TaxID=3053516 RepID=UPI002578641C|nr:ABC transporter substrate-binding protein [Variovorax sp. J22R187]MDM0021878.1 ABC transporter substrate-binding protein [Variovorax sp. J22R187]
MNAQEERQAFLRAVDQDTRLALSRRGLLSVAAAGALTAGLAPLSFAQAKRFEGRKLVHTSWGGVYQESQKAAYCEPFALETGSRIIQDGPMNEAKLRTMVGGGSPDWDVCDVTDTFLFAGGSALFEKVDYKTVQRNLLVPEYAQEYGVGNNVWSYNVCYNTKSFAPGSGPKTWADIFDVKRFPGKRMFRNRVYSTLEIALLADGVEPSKLYPLDVERAFRKLDTIRNDITWWNTPSQSQQLISDGAVTCGVIQNGRAFDASRKGAPLAIEWAQNLRSVDYLVVLKGSKNVDVAMHLINRSIQADAQARFVNATAYAPVTPEAFTKVENSLLPWLASQKDNAARGVTIDGKWWSDKLESMNDRWNKWRVA